MYTFVYVKEKWTVCVFEKCVRTAHSSLTTPVALIVDRLKTHTKKLLNKSVCKERQRMRKGIGREREQGMTADGILSDGYA